MASICHPTPLDAARIGDLVQRDRATILLATPTFLQLYLRRCAPAQFGSLRLILAGAEKLSEALALTFEDAFGIRPMEGYGMTECAPVVAVNTFDHREPGFFQPGSRRGYVGRPLPGVAVRIVQSAEWSVKSSLRPSGDQSRTPVILPRGVRSRTGWRRSMPVPTTTS